MLDEKDCPVCFGSFNPKRKEQETCSYKCSKTKERNPRWKGNNSIGADGYPITGGAGRTHREIAEKVLNRKLTSNEIVHHINKDITDNRNCNLLICTRGYHTWLHGAMRRQGRSE